MTSRFHSGHLEAATQQTAMPHRVPSAWTALAIAAAAAGSAGLFFLELLAGKILLPLFGGAPGVWVSCLAFFQMALVAATVYADRLVRLRRPGVQLAAQAAVFAIAAAVAPLGIATAVSWAQPESHVPLPLLTIAVLTAGVGPVFFAFATLSPLFGHWRSRWPDVTADGTRSGQAAYGLYAAGNAGSFAMLAAYPTLIEPLAGIPQQVDAASRLFLTVAVLMLIVGGITVFLAAAPSGPRASPVATSVGTWRQWLWWAALAALPASWLASVTTHATVEIAPIPLLWIVPLGVYLASFVMVFTTAGRRLRRYEGSALMAASGTAIWLVASGYDFHPAVGLTLHVAAFGVACICVHGMLVDDRPPPERLSSFYLAMAVGGACGGLWNALGAPAVFDAHHEFPMAVACSAGLAPVVVRLRPAWRIAAVAAVALLVGSVVFIDRWCDFPQWCWLAAVGIAVVVPAVAFSGAERAAALFALAVCTFLIAETSEHVVHRERTFFGVLRVCESSNGPSTALFHGSIRHGVQLVSDDLQRRRIPLTYYAEAGPLGSVFRGLDETGRRGRVGVAGLGVGTVASYARPGDEYVFYEIDPAVVRIAEDVRWFSFLSDCRGATRVVTDDARRALEREADGSLDLLIIDAFTGDSVPTHLLTREAFDLYGRKLHPEGVVALHVSNNYLDFVPVVEAIAAAGDWKGVYARDFNISEGAVRVPSEWMAVSRSFEAIKAIYTKPHPSNHWLWTPCAEFPASRPWTDDHTAVIEALWHRWAIPR